MTEKHMALRAISTVLWEKWVEFKFEWRKITATALVSPLLYMIALGWGLGSGVLQCGDGPALYRFPGAGNYCPDDNEHQLFRSRTALECAAAL